MRAVSAAALRHLASPVLYPTETMSDEAVDRREDDIDDAIAALVYILGRFHPRWTLARHASNLKKRLAAEGGPGLLRRP